jgi:hypothetical protein
MQVTLALLADYANVTADGKLNILGIFDRVLVPAFPAVHPQMQLVIRLSAEYAEKDRPQNVEITFDDPDGRRLLSMKADMVVQAPIPGQRAMTQQILTLGNVRFDRAGGHTFNFFINNHLSHHIPLDVQKIPTPEQPSFPEG